MKLVFIITILFNTALTLSGGAVFDLTEKKHDFPDAKEGEVVSHTFHFTNTGDEPLIITGYEVACNCTRLTYPEKPVLPGEKGELTLIFETGGKQGYQNRQVIVKSNAKKETKITFRIFVQPAD
jgi:hypothetical protein